MEERHLRSMYEADLTEGRLLMAARELAGQLGAAIEAQVAEFCSRALEELRGENEALRLRMADLGGQDGETPAELRREAEGSREPSTDEEWVTPPSVMLGGQAERPKAPLLLLGGASTTSAAHLANRSAGRLPPEPEPPAWEAQPAPPPPAACADGQAGAQHMATVVSKDGLPEAAYTVGPHRSILSCDRMISKDSRMGAEMSLLSTAALFGRRARDRRHTGRTERLVKSLNFESLFAVFILFNCANMGIQAHEMVNPNTFSAGVKLSSSVLEHICTLVFFIEFLMRFYAYGWRSYIPTTAEGRGNLLDAVLAVVTGVIFTWVVPLVQLALGSRDSQSSANALTIVRVIRLTRLFRIFHRVPWFREAWIIIRGAVSSGQTLFWTCCLIILVTYIFAIFGLNSLTVELQGHLHETSSAEEVAEIQKMLGLVGGVDTIMMTLIQFLTEDEFHTIIREMIIFVPWAWVYFYSYMAVGCFVLMNLVTAVIVENAMSNAAADVDHLVREKETKVRKELKELRAMFALLDADGNGFISWDEFQASFKNEALMKKWTLLDFRREDCEELFALLDDNHDGQIALAEFFEGLQRMKGAAHAKDVYRLQRAVDKLPGAAPFSPRPSS